MVVGKSIVHTYTLEQNKGRPTRLPEFTLPTVPQSSHWHLHPAVLTHPIQKRLTGARPSRTSSNRESPSALRP
eukprot:4347166-Prymnesium_polylepis.1